MIRKQIIVNVLLALAVAGSVLAVQQKKTPTKKHPAPAVSTTHLEGEIASINTGAHELTLRVQESGKAVERQVVTDSNTKFVDAGKTVTLSALKVGDKVTARCHKDGMRTIASEVTVKRS